MFPLRRLTACLILVLACAGCPSPATTPAPTASTAAPATVATPRPVPSASFGAPVFPVPKPVGTRPPDPVSPPPVGATPVPPIPTTGGQVIESALPSVEPTLPPPPGIETFDLPQLGVNVNLFHGGKGEGNATGYLTQMLFRSPVGVALGVESDIYIADTGNNLIRISQIEVLPSGGTTRAGSTYAGDGTAGHADGFDVRAKFNSPRGVAFHGADLSVWVTDSLNHCIRRIRIEPAPAEQTPQVKTVAGSPGKAGHKDAVEQDALFNEPWGIAVDKDGNAYVTDTKNHCIRKITPAFVVTTLAGTPGASGHKDGAGKTAQFSEPKGIAIDPSGEIYVCDTGNHCVRKVSAAGVVSTLAGVPASPGFKNGPGEVAQFDTPIGIAYNPDGALYVSDFGNDRIRLVSKKGVVSNFAGAVPPAPPPTPQLLDGPGAFALFDGPQGILVDDAKDLFVAEEGNHSLRKILLENVVTTEWGSTVPGDDDDAFSLAGFKLPTGIVYDGKSLFYIADAGNHTIRTINKNGAVTTLAGKAGDPGNADGLGTAAQFDTPRAVALDADGNVYVADEGNHLIRKIAPDGTVTTIAGSGTVGFADAKGTAAAFHTPRGIAVGPDGNVFVADFGNHRIRMITPDGTVTTHAGDGKAGFSDGQLDKARFAKPSGISIDASGRLYIADFGNNAIRVIQKDSTTLRFVVGTLAGATAAPGFVNGSGGTAQFNDPWGLVVDAVGRVFVADSGNSLIRKITPDGTVSTYAGRVDPNFGRPISGHLDGAGTDAKFAAPSGLAIDELGYVFVVDTQNNCIRKIH